MALGEVAGRWRGSDWPEVGGAGRVWPGRAVLCRAGPPPAPAPARRRHRRRPRRRPPPAAGGAMRPAPLLGLLLWAPLLWAPPPPVRGRRHGVYWNGSNPR